MDIKIKVAKRYIQILRYSKTAKSRPQTETGLNI
jgi:hypothetical protein